MYRAYAELFAVPGYSPDLGQRAMMNGLLRAVGKFNEAIVMGQSCLSEMSRSFPNRWKMRYELGFSPC